MRSYLGRSMGIYRCSWCGVKLPEGAVTAERHLFCSEEHERLWKENPSLQYNQDYNYIPGEKVKCFWCKNEYELRQCRQRYYHSDPQSWQQLAGREGYVYDCPECGKEIHQNWIRMS